MNFIESSDIPPFFSDFLQNQPKHRAMVGYFATSRPGLTINHDFIQLSDQYLYKSVSIPVIQAVLFYGVLTYGNPDYNVTEGLGLGFSKSNFGTSKSKSSAFEFGKYPMITVCGTARIARKIALVTENWIIPSSGNSGVTYYPVYSYGVRFFGETVAFDLAFINNKDIASILFIGIPFISCTVKF